MTRNQNCQQKPTPVQLHSQDYRLLLFDALNVSPPNCTICILTFGVVDGLPSILELLRVLVNVLDPDDQQHTDSTRLTVLGILNAALEEAGPQLVNYPSLEALVIDSGCKHLFQLARSENIILLQHTLRTITTVMDTMRVHLKLQQELFLAFSIDRLAPLVSTTGQRVQSSVKKQGVVPARSGASTPIPTPEVEPPKDATASPRVIVPPARGQTRDLLLEALGQISRSPSFMVDLYANYDCDVNCENLFERLIDFLTRVRHFPHCRLNRLSSADVVGGLPNSATTREL